MCINKYKIRNRYTHRELWVDCGHCPACLQRKANTRADRISMHHEGLKSDYFPWFFHLTYLNECVPYVRREDLHKYNDELSEGSCISPIPVYRDYDRVYKRQHARGRKRNYKLVYQRLDEPIGYLDMADEEGVPFSDELFDLDSIPSLQDTYHPRITTKSMSDKIGVCWTRDFQNFMKKLKRELDKNGISQDFSYWYTFEYGGKKYRPHIHVLLWCPRGYEAAFKAAALKSWTYAYRYRTEARFERAISPSKYVATYVNKPSDFPSLLSSHSFREKCNHSKGFATTMRVFQLDTILEKLRKGDLTYNRRVFSNGSPIDVPSPYPSYVISRYFPKYYGFRCIPDGEIRRLSVVYDRPSGITDAEWFELRRSRLWTHLDYQFYKSEVPLSHVGEPCDPLDDIASDIVRRCDRFNLTVSEYLDLWCSVWSLHKSTLLKFAWKGKSLTDSWYMYDNIGDYFIGKVSSESLDELMFVTPNDFEYVDNPNDFPDNVASSEHLSLEYASKFQKHSLNSEFINDDI